MMEIKAFLAKPKHQYRVSQCGEHYCSGITKIMEIITSIQVCLSSWITLIIRKTEERKAFLAKSKLQFCVSQYGEHDCGA